MMRASAAKEKVEETQEEEPEAEPSFEPEIAADMDFVEEEAAPSVQLPLQETYDAEEADESEGREDDLCPSKKDEEEPEVLTERQWPSLEEYQKKWETKLAEHSKPNAEEGFSRQNLVPVPIPQLWQDCPYVPFDELKTEDAMSRLGRCRPVSGFRPSHCEDSRVMFAHNTGEVNFRRRAPLQLASTLGFILNKRSGKFLGLTPAEQEALHECLTWLRQPGNNRHCFYGDELEHFDKACSRLMQRIKSIVPEGCTRARIRATSRVTRKPEHGTLADTLGDEARGMVVVDFDGHPQKYDDLKILSDVVAKEVNVLKIDVPRGDTGRGWKRTHSEIDLPEGEAGEMAAGARYVIEETWIKAGEPHYDAKVWHFRGTLTGFELTWFENSKMEITAFYMFAVALCSCLQFVVGKWPEMEGNCGTPQTQLTQTQFRRP